MPNIHDFERLYNMPYEERIKELSTYTPDQKARFNNYVKQKIDETNKKKKSKPLVWIAVILSVLIAANLLSGIILYGVGKSRVHSEVLSAFKQHACDHGIMVDKQWFRTADEMTDYILDEYAHIKWHFIYTEFKVNSYTYSYHKNDTQMVEVSVYVWQP